MPLTLEQRVYQFLRDHQGSTARQIAMALDAPLGEIEEILELGIVGEYLEETHGYYYLKIVLQRLKKPPETGVWIYEDIATGMGRNLVGAAPDEFEPVRLDQLAPRNQGRSPTCGGQTGASVMDDMHLSLVPEDAPTEADKAQYKHNVLLNPLDPLGTRYDVLYPVSFSAAGAYWRSKQREGIQEPGTYIEAVAKLLKEEGLGKDHQWYNAKDGKSAWMQPYPNTDETGESYAVTAADHRTIGYARVTTVAGMLDYLRTHNGVGIMIAWAVASETMQQAKLDGRWTAWRGSNIGGHATSVKGIRGGGFDFLNWWTDEGYPPLQWMSIAGYWAGAKQDCIVILDDAEKAFARTNLYRHVTFRFDHEAAVKIDGLALGNTTNKQIGAELRVGEHTLDAVRLDNPLKLIVMKFIVDKNGDTYDLMFPPDPEPPEPPQPPQPPQPDPFAAMRAAFERMRQRFREIFKKLFGRLQDSDCPHWQQSRCMLDRGACVGYARCVTVNRLKLR